MRMECVSNRHLVCCMILQSNHTTLERSRTHSASFREVRELDWETGRVSAYPAKTLRLGNPTTTGSDIIITLDNPNGALSVGCSYLKFTSRSLCCLQHSLLSSLFECSPVIACGIAYCLCCRWPGAFYSSFPFI